MQAVARTFCFLARKWKIITGASAFNIKAESLRMGDFVKEEVQILLHQHTTEKTG